MRLTLAQVSPGLALAALVWSSAACSSSDPPDSAEGESSAAVAGSAAGFSQRRRPDGGLHGAEDAGGAGTSSGGGSDSGGANADAGPSDASAPPPADAGGATTGGAFWAPPSTQPVHFHWQLTDTFSAADLLAGQQGLVVYDIDGEGATAADVAAIHAAGAKAVCYVDVGGLEKGRSDYSSFPASVVGPAMAGWPGESWLLVTAANQPILRPLMKARFETWCAAKGFDAIEPDNLDTFSNIKGVTEADNLAYDLALAGMAHGLSLSIGLKNLLPDVSDAAVSSLVSTFDWALVEQCFQYGECAVYSAPGSFVATGKAVWDVEYNQAPNCAVANAQHVNAQRRDLDLVAPTASKYDYAPCVDDAQTTW